MSNANVAIFYQCKDCGAIQPPRGCNRPGSSTRQKPIRYVDFRCPDCCNGPAQYFRNAVEDRAMEDSHARGEYRDGLSSRPGLYGANQPYGRHQQRNRARIFDEMPNGNGRSHHPFSGSSGGETYDEGHFQPSMLREVSVRSRAADDGFSRTQSQASHLYDDDDSDDDAHFDHADDFPTYGRHRSQAPPGYLMGQPQAVPIHRMAQPPAGIPAFTLEDPFSPHAMPPPQAAPAYRMAQPSVAPAYSMARSQARSQAPPSYRSDAPPSYRSDAPPAYRMAQPRPRGGGYDGYGRY